jgi:hypothetical protein
MGYLEPNEFTRLRGKVGKTLYVAKYGDKYVVKEVPQRAEKEATAAQKPVRQELMNANRYWRSVKTQPELKAIYDVAAKLRKKRACDLAKADFIHPPTVRDIDLSGYQGQPSERIVIVAEDDFEVSSAQVRIHELDGTVIEQGGAAADGASGHWVYLGQTAILAGKAVVVEVTTTDRPGNKAVKSVDHVCGPRS